MKEYILEACVDSVESAMAAVEGGADRLELCGNLIIGGTTPGPWLFDEIRKRSDIRIHALIRPRFGDFCYTDAEFSMIKHAVEDFRKMGAEGVVFGVLKPDGTLNMEQMKELMEAAGDMSVTLHRNNGTGNLTGNQYDPYFRPAQCMSAGGRSFAGTRGKESWTYHNPGRKRCRRIGDPTALSSDRNKSISHDW